MSEPRDRVDFPALRPYPTRLIVESSSRCNLACAMCPKQSGGMAGLGGGDMAESVFSALEPAFPRAESLVLNGIGEPLLHPGLEDFVRAARRSLPPAARIGFQSNGILLDGRRAEALLEAGLDKACISVDSLQAGLYGGLRAGGELGAAISAIDALAAAKARLGRADFEIGIEFVAMRDNLLELPGLVRWAASRGVGFVIVSQLFPYGKDALALTAYDASLDLAVELLAKYREEGRGLGVDIGRYPEIYMRYRKSPEEEEIVRLVGAMQEEAVSRGISLNVERLFARDPGPTELARSAFAAAAEAAAGEGISIALPEAAPRGARSCEFVEGGSAFVSWEGEVHPCYFLWHRYDCHVGGYEKRVAPRSFGNVARRGVLEIWNDPAFASFRSNVLRYEYPFCLNCNLALCDYVQLPDFEQDCHMNAEPCAACLWCMGLFKCMA